MATSVDQIVAALHALHSPGSNESMRQQANVFLEAFKSQQPPQLAISNNLIVAQTGALPPLIDSNVVRHYGLLCLEHIVLHQWKSLSDADKTALQHQSMQLLSYCAQLQQQSPVPTYVKNKFVSIAVQIILREYPQRYADLHEQLAKLITQYNQTGTELVMHVYKSVCDEIVNFTGGLPDKRRRDIQTSFINNMAYLYNLFFTTLQQSFTLYSTDKSALNKSVVLSTIDTIKYICEFINSSYLFDSNLIQHCCTQLNNTEFYAPLMELLDAIARRKTSTMTSTQQYSQVVQLYRVICSSIQSLLAMQTFAHQHLFLHTTLIVLNNLLKLHSSLLHAKEYDSVKQAVLITLDQLLRCDRVSISVVGVELFTFIIRSTGDHILLPAYINSVIPELVNTATMKLQKPLKTPGEDDDDTSDHKNDFGTYRGALLHLLTALAERHTHVVLNVALHKYTTLSYTSQLDHINQRGFASTETALYRYIEALGAMLDTSMRCVTSQQLAADASLLDTAEKLLQVIVTHTTQDPLLLTLRLHDISLFTSLYNAKPVDIQAVLPVLFEGITFQSSVPYNDQHEDVRATRKRAIYSLIAIGRKCSQHIESILTQLTDTVMRLVQTQQIAEVEKILLYEFLITTSQSTTDREKRQQFILQLITPSIQYITSTDLAALFSVTERMLSLLGVNDLSVLNQADATAVHNALAATASKQQRVELLNTVNTLVSVYKPIFQSCTTLLPNESQQQHPVLTTIAAQLLPNLFVLLNFIASYRSLEASIPAELKGVLCGSNEQLVLQISSPDDKQSILVVDVKRWLDRMIDAVCMLLSLLFKTGINVYRVLQPSHLHQSVTANIQHLHHYQLRHIHEKIIMSLLQSCIPEAYHSLLGRVIPPLFDMLSQRYTTDWQALKQQQQSNAVKSGNVENEIYEENQLRESSHGLIDCLFRPMIEFDHLHIHEAAAATAGANGVHHKPADAHDKKQSARSLSEHALFATLMSDMTTAQSILKLCNTMLQTPDSITQHRATMVSTRLLVFLTQNTYNALLQCYVDIMLNTLMVLSTITIDDNNQLELDLIEFIKEIFVTTHRLHCTGSVVHVLTQQCGVPLDTVNNLTEAVSTEMSDKKYRLMFKNVLRQCVIGKNNMTALATGGNVSKPTIDNLSGTVPIQSHINAAVKQQNKPDIDPSSLAQLFNQ